MQSPTDFADPEEFGASGRDPSAGPSGFSAGRRPASDGDLQLALDAAARWRSRASERKRKVTALENQQYTEADTPEHLAEWIIRRRLWSGALAGGGGGSSKVAEAVAAELVRPEHVTDALVERIIGETNDLLSIEFFELGLLAARCVGRVVTQGRSGTRYGTGFLVASGLMLTNQHVLRTASDARGSVLELDYEDNRIGEAKRVHTFRHLPDRFFLNDEPLDFAIVAVEMTCVDGDAQLDSFKSLPLIDAHGKARVGDPVNIVQHPGGRLKQVVVRNNQILDLPDGADDDKFVHYKAAIEQGSSGFPVFNDFWEVICLDHSGVPKTNDRGELVDKDGNVLIDPRPADIVWVGNEGIPISSVVQAFSEAELAPAMAALRDKALATWQHRGNPFVAGSVAADPNVVTDDALHEPPATRAQGKSPVRAESGGIFVSYRREDTQGVAGRLYDRLVEAFGETSVFMDVAGIEPGMDYQRAIHEQINKCRVLLVLIGARWLSATDMSGSRRLDDADDLVRLEVASALSRDVLVIPVLVDGASAPNRHELPDPLSALAVRNAAHLRHESFGTDVALVIRVIGRALRI